MALLVALWAETTRCLSCTLVVKKTQDETISNKSRSKRRSIDRRFATLSLQRSWTGSWTSYLTICFLHKLHRCCHTLTITWKCHSRRECGSLRASTSWSNLRKRLRKRRRIRNMMRIIYKSRLSVQCKTRFRLRWSRPTPNLNSPRKICSPGLKKTSRSSAHRFKAEMTLQASSNRRRTAEPRVRSSESTLVVPYLFTKWSILQSTLIQTIGLRLAIRIFTSRSSWLREACLPNCAITSAKRKMIALILLRRRSIIISPIAAIN